jgi:hypothetical protein
MMVEDGEDGPVRQAQTANESERALRSKGQRDTSELWEETQRDLALLTVRGTVAAAFVAAIFGAWLHIIDSVRMAAFVFLYGIANLVVGFYFGRTNHTRVGGIGGDNAGER